MMKKFKKNFPELKQIQKELTVQFNEAQIFTVAGSLAYTTILSIVPLMAVSFAIFKAFGGLEKIFSIVEPFVLENLAEGTSQEVIGFIRTFVTNAHTSAVGLGGLIALIFTSMSMLSSAEKAIHNVWKIPLTRTFFHRIAIYWLFITLGPLGLAVAVGISSTQQVAIWNLLPSGTSSLLLNTFIFFMIYKFVPTTKVRAACALIPAAICALVFGLAKVFYNIYTSQFVSYNKVYGSLGAVPIILIWIYISWVIVLSGAAFSATLQKRNLDKMPKMAK